MRRMGRRVAALFILGVYLSTLLAGFLAPYDPSEQDRRFPYAAPFHLTLTAANGVLHLTCRSLSDTARSLSDTSRSSSDSATVSATRAEPTDTQLAFLVHGRRYQILPALLGTGQADLHFFGTASPAPCFLLGTDGYGRDQLTRLLYGARISLWTGLLAALLSLGIGTALGSLAGMAGLWTDEVLMRLGEISMSVPSLYLLLGVRALLPLRTDPTDTFLILVTLIGITGWVRPARLVRGAVLSLKERDYVKIARGFGAGPTYVLWRHILPQLGGLLMTQLAVLVPLYVFAEVTLSFVGLGVNEPIPSWGNMLTPLQQFAVLDTCWWMFAPAAAAIPVALACYVLSLSYGFKMERGSFL